MISGIILLQPRWSFSVQIKKGALRIAEFYQLLAPRAAQRPLVIASGRALSNSKFWTQILSDALGEPLVISSVPEITERGTALLALRSLGIVKTLEEFPSPFGSTFKPVLAAHKIHLSAMQDQRNLYGNVYIEGSLTDGTI
jgi:sugar (pentulose or hexulose) kinase